MEVGDWAKAETKYEEVISLKKSVYGSKSLPAAKTVNDYAVVLAKHGRLEEALRQYEEARGIYEALLKLEKNQDLHLLASFDFGESANLFSFDMTLIDLNIASIKSKKGDYKGALVSYEKGVVGLRLYLEQERNHGSDFVETTKMTAQKRHLVSAIGRIGSLKMKLRDNKGALEAYLTLLKEVDNSSPISSKMEKAKAHVKCATIYRQMGNREDNRNAVVQLKEALQMYTQLHGTTHKDTQAIASSLRQWKEQDALSNNL